MVRCFVGFMLPEDVRLAAAGVQRRLSGFEIECKAVETENMHICLSFLGEVEDSKIEELKAAMDSIAKEHRQFYTKIGGVKFIPTENYIRVIALETADESGELEKLRNDVVNGMGGDSKPPHLTLCRVRHVEDKKKLVDGFAGFSIGSTFLVDGIELIKSELSRNGPVYTVLHRSRLS
jgi:2'-5' RNA ligase